MPNGALARIFDRHPIPNKPILAQGRGNFIILGNY